MQNLHGLSFAVSSSLADPWLRCLSMLPFASEAQIDAGKEWRREHQNSRFEVTGPITRNNYRRSIKSKDRRLAGIIPDTCL